MSAIVASAINSDTLSKLCSSLFTYSDTYFLEPSQEIKHLFPFTLNSNSRPQSIKKISAFFQTIHLRSNHVPFAILHNVLFYRKFRLCIAKAQGKAHTPKAARAYKGSPSGRAPAIAGERVIVAIVRPLRRLHRHLSQRERLFVSLIITRIGRESKSYIPTSSE